LRIQKLLLYAPAAAALLVFTDVSVGANCVCPLGFCDMARAYLLIKGKADANAAASKKEPSAGFLLFA